VAVVTERELERLADMVADRLALRLSGALAPTPRLVGVAELADALGVERSFVYRHAAELGGRKLGASRNAPLRFDVQEAAAALRQVGERSQEPPPAPQRRSRRRALSRAGSETPLLPIRPARGKL
jgi:DNA-binding IclR family transcriptional regulator